MTTKKFQLIINENINEYATRNEAIDVMTALLKTDDKYTPQDFKIVEVEVVDEEKVVKETADYVAKSLGIFCTKFEIKPYFVHGEGFLEMHISGQKYPSLGINEIKQLMQTLDKVNADLPEGYFVFFTITHECAIRLMLGKPTEKKQE